MRREATLELAFNWDLLRRNCNGYMNAKHLSRQDFAYACDLEPTQVHKLFSMATHTGALALMTLYRIAQVLGTPMELYIIDNRLK